MARVPALPVPFFFSSRRRHTRWTGDWSSDVCSSDLAAHGRAESDGVAIRVGVCPLVFPPRKVLRLRDLRSGSAPFGGQFVGIIDVQVEDRKSTRLNSSHPSISYAVFCLKKKTTELCA